MIALILLLIIVIVAVAAVNLMNRTLNRQGKFSYSQRVLWIFGGYTVILVLCLGITSIFPPSEIAGIKRVNSKELDEENVTLYNAASEGKFDEINRKFISKTWEFVYNGQQLNLAGPKQEDLNTAIMVERKNTNDNKIEAFYFRTHQA